MKGWWSTRSSKHRHASLLQTFPLVVDTLTGGVPHVSPNLRDVGIPIPLALTTKTTNMATVDTFFLSTLNNQISTMITSRYFGAPS